MGHLSPGEASTHSAIIVAHYREFPKSSPILVVGQFEVNIAFMIDQLGHDWTVNMNLPHHPDFGGVLVSFLASCLQSGDLAN